ncbi:MAG TPA: hypothetical protein PKX38_06310 [Alphaproteobacteria bacterium]|mgnify:CR=1 FL=1|nr:hypothetical protein [Micavibrio sp.]HQX27533.1 hypothetical protein [Alphaproteobacteria bacterium]
MHNSATQSFDYALLSTPGKNAQSIDAQASTLLASVEVKIQREPEILEEYDREHFEQRLSSVFNRNATINSIRGAKHSKSLLKEIQRSFYNFKTVTFLLETDVSTEVEDAVVTLIANKALEKRGLSQPQPEIKKPVPTSIIPFARTEKTREQKIADKKRLKDELKLQQTAVKKQQKEELKTARQAQRKTDLKIAREEDRKTLELMRPLMEEAQTQLLQESMSSPGEYDPAKTAEVAKQVLSYINRALELKLVNVMGGQKYLAIAFRETFNHHADLVKLQTKTPQLAEKVTEKFRHVLIAATRLKVKLNPHVKSAIIDALIQKVEADAVESRERVRQTAIKNGQTDNARETARKVMTEWRNDPVKNAERAQKLKKVFQRRGQRSALLKKLNEDPVFIEHQRAHLKRLNGNAEIIAQRRAQFADPYFIAKREEGLKKLYKTPEFKAQRRRQLKVLNKDPDIIARRREQLAKLNSDPDFIARRRAQLEKMNNDPERIRQRLEQIIRMNKDPANIARKIKKIKNNPLLIAQLNEHLKKAQDDPAFREKHLAGIHAYWAERRAEKAHETLSSEVSAIEIEASDSETMAAEEFALIPE